MNFTNISFLTQVNNFNSSFSDGRALCYLIHHYHPQLLTLESIKDETTLTQVCIQYMYSVYGCAVYCIHVFHLYLYLFFIPQYMCLYTWVDLLHSTCGMYSKT